MSINAFTAVRTEGSLLPPDLLARVAAADKDIPGLRAEDFGLTPGERINDAIVASWTRLNGVWQIFADKLDRAPATETSFESLTRKLWIVPLLQELGFDKLVIADPLVIDDKPYPVSHRASGIAIHLLGARVDLDRRPTHGIRPAHGMMQEFLNRSPDHLWGVITNGLRIRLLRDSSSLTRQALCEFDVEAIFRGQQYAEFALLWLVCHASRFTAEPPSACILETWANLARTDGTRALDQLRGGVEASIEALGNGFLSDPANEGLRRRLRDGELTLADFQHQLLRLVYRLLFLLVAEARGLVAAPDAEAVAVQRYQRFYSINRLVEMARAQRGTAHGDLWDGLRVVFAALAGPGSAPLGLYGMGSYLWSPDAISDLGPAALSNRHLLEAVARLTNVTETASKGGNRTRRAVDYRNLGAEELGSVYESLLELHPAVDGTVFKLATAAGNERKTTGSYYTPTSLIRVLLDSALDPVLDEAEAKDDPEAALLALKVIDPAVGSGHFLIAAAHRIAQRLASVRSGESEASPNEVRHALRDVIGHCIYGIDVNPMAVELCKVSLWMEATEPGRPLGFLDHRIVCGNSLLGAVPALIDAGVPDEAFKPLTGDVKSWVSTLKKRNKTERTHRMQGTLEFGPSTSAVVDELAGALAKIEAMPDDTVQEIAAKEAGYSRLQHSSAAAQAKLVADAWCAAFVVLKVEGAPIITDEVVRNCQRDPSKVPADVHRAIDEMAQQYGFLHLHVAFPDVFEVPVDPETAENQLTGWSGGFDVVLGNPPWDRVKLQEKEWFAVRDPEVASAPNAAARKRLIARLVDEQPELHAAFLAASRTAAGESTLLRNSGRFPLCGRGDVNTYAVFAELMHNAISPTGRVGVIVPTGIATDDTTKLFFADLVDRGALASLFDFENRLAVFPGVHRSYKFALLTLSGDDCPVADAEFVFFALDVSDLEDPERRVTFQPADFELLNPNTRTCPLFRSRRDAELTKRIFRAVPILSNESEEDLNSWGAYFLRLVHYGDHRDLIEETDDAAAGRPVFEAKTTHQFDHRWANKNGEFSPIGLRLDPSSSVSQRFRMRPDDFEMIVAKYDYSRDWFLAVRGIARSTDARTLIASAIPRGPASVKLVVIGSRPASPLWCLIGVLDSFVVDYIARQFFGGTDVTIAGLRQLPVLSVSRLSGDVWRGTQETVADFISKRVLELSYTAWDLAGFAADLGYHGPPFRWDEERRALLRAELDALMFRLYGIERDDVDYILDTFPIVKRKDEAAFGEYRTKRLILERFDAMAEAEASGREYVTILDPPPVDPRCAHPESSRPAWAAKG